MDNEKREASIEYILARGLTAPPRARRIVRELLCDLGPRFIFWDTAYGVVFGLLTLAPLLAITALAPETLRYSVATAVAPSLFLIITVFAETAERFGGLYELKQTCRYTAAQVTALRVMCYSLAGIVYSAVVTLLCFEEGFEFASLLSLCLSALFVCAALSLFVLRRLHGRWTGALFAAAWAFVNIAAPYGLGEGWERFLSGLPIAVSAAVALAGAAAFAYQTRKMLTEGRSYAVA
ncbi:MAG: hypothetical protein LBB57_00660 [Clostridiales Family XIII bacterium]|jgi:hypothetical protein|nr:hypothetical protein [Clostridiales Family XIII bacterium]